MIALDIKYNKEHGKVYIDYKVSANEPIISISDNGIGMNVSEIKQLGKPFYRSAHMNIPGTGLGFAIAKKLTTILHWRLMVKSKKDHGTQINLYILKRKSNIEHQQYRAPTKKKRHSALL